MSQNNLDEVLHTDKKEISKTDIADITSFEDDNESSLLNSIVEAVMRGDMNQVVTLALSHRNIEFKDKLIADEALHNNIMCDQNKALETDIDNEANVTVFDNDDDVTAIEISELSDSTKNYAFDVSNSNSICPTSTKSEENSDLQCSYYIGSSSVIEPSNNITYCQSGFRSPDINAEDPSNGNFTNYQTTSIHNTTNVNSQSVQVQLPGIGNFLLQIPSNLKPGEPITLPLNFPLTPVSQTNTGNPISINMNTGQLISNQLLSLYNPSSCINTVTIGKKMRAIAPKPTYRPPLIAPKTNSPCSSLCNQDGVANQKSLPAPNGPGRRKGSKGKKVGRKKGTMRKSHKESSYASSTHSIDSQETIQFNEPCNSLKMNSNNFITSRNTYPGNYYVNSDSSDYINQTHSIHQSYNEIQTHNLIDTSDSGEKDLLSLAWEISNAELGNNDEFPDTYQLYDGNNLSSENFVSSEILDQFLQNIQKDEIRQTTRNGLDHQRASYTSSFTTLPPCSTVLPSVTTSNYLNNSCSNLSQNMEIAEVVNLNTEDILLELEKDDENALLDKFVAQYSSSQTNSLKCDTHVYRDLNSETTIEIVNYLNINEADKVDDCEKDLDPSVKESNELSEIAKQIEKDCNELNLVNTQESKVYIDHFDYDYQDQLNDPYKINENDVQEINSTSLSGSNTTTLRPTYSASTDSLSSTIVDCQSQYFVPLLMDNQSQGESSFYPGDGLLQSKTLDDFGLFDFCTGSGEIPENVSVEEKKYLEPPILEDISDATPIPTDDETEDEDIDPCAFKLSSLTSLQFYSNNVYDVKRKNTGNMSYNSSANDWRSLLDEFHADNQSCSSDKWYIYDNVVTLTDVFSYLENKSDKNCLSVPSTNATDNFCIEREDVKQSEMENVTSTILKGIAKDGECQKIRKRTIHKNKCYPNDRHNRLRKSPSKLEIFHSMKLADKDIPSNNIETFGFEADIKRIYNYLKFKHNIKVNHCTRSKGSISKSYASFYETLERSKRHQHSKKRKLTGNFRNKKKLNTGQDIDGLISEEIEVINLSNLVNSIDTILNDTETVDSKLPSCDPKLSTDVRCIKVGSYCSKNDRIMKMSKISKRYKLRGTNHFFKSNLISGIETVVDEKLTNDSQVRYSKRQKKKLKKNCKIEDHNGFTNNEPKIYVAQLNQMEDNFDLLIIDNPIMKQLSYIESNSSELHRAIIITTHTLLSGICNVTCTINEDCDKEVDKWESSCRKYFPVRKINRKLRLLSGLERDKNINFATIMDIDVFEYLTKCPLNIQVINSNIFISSLRLGSDCIRSEFTELEVQSVYQVFETNDDDFDDGLGCDIRLVIVESDRIPNETILKKDERNNIVQLEIKNGKKEYRSKNIAGPKQYLLRNKTKDIAPLNISLSPVSNKLKRHSLRRSCKKKDTEDILTETILAREENTISKYMLKTPICAIEKLTNDDLIANLSREYFFLNFDQITKHDNDVNLLQEKLIHQSDRSKFNRIPYKNNKITSKIISRIKTNKVKLEFYRNHAKSIRKSQKKKKLNYSSRLKEKFCSKILFEIPKLQEDLQFIENSLTKITFEAENLSKKVKENANGVPNLCSYVDSNNFEIFTRRYGSLSLKIKFRKEDPTLDHENKAREKKRPKTIKKRKSLRRLLNGIIGYNNFDSNKSIFTDESNDVESRGKRLKTRKRKHLHTMSSFNDINDQDSLNLTKDVGKEFLPQFVPELTVNDDIEKLNPIKIKLFKSISNDCSTSEEIIFSFQKMNNENKKENKKLTIPKMSQDLKEQPPKPSRQAANLAKKKIFSTAKSNRRCKNATLISAWKPRKINKLKTELLNSCNDLGRRPRGRPPKSNHMSLLDDKDTSSTGSKKLKICISKDFKNSNDDNQSSNGEISGRTSTNDSSILNSVVGRITEPIDVLSLESNHFINGITQQLEDNLKYLEAKDAKQKE